MNYLQSFFEPAPRSPRRNHNNQPLQSPPDLNTLNRLVITAELLPWFKSSPDVLAPCQNLRTLLCEGHERALTRLPTLPNTLEELYCTQNAITALPANLPPMLNELYCGENRLVILPELPETLTALVCNNNALSSLPDLPDGLEYLKCSSNALYELPDEFPNALKTITCNDNQISALPRLPEALEVFNCAKNQISALPRQLPEQLEIFICDHNQITTIPPLPTNLKEFNCSFNLIERLPQLPHSLRKFDCTGNPMIEQPYTPFGTMPERFNLDAESEHAESEGNYDGDFDFNFVDEFGDTIDTGNVLHQMYDNTAATPLSTSTATISPDDTGYDAIMMTDENVGEYLQSAPDNIVFKTGGSFALQTKSAIAAHVITNPSFIKYGCLRVDDSIIPRRENVNMDVPYVTGRGLGLSTGVIPLSQIKTLLVNVAIQAVEIVATGQQLPSTASFQMMQPNADAVSASHCQEGQGEAVYEMRVIRDIGTHPTSRVGGTHKRKKHNHRRTRTRKQNRHHKHTVTYRRRKHNKRRKTCRRHRRPLWQK